MVTNDSPQFPCDLDKKLWSASDRLRANLDAAVYKHAVLGLIFLKYVSDSFAIRQREIEAQLRELESDYFLDPALRIRGWTKFWAYYATEGRLSFSEYKGRLAGLCGSKIVRPSTQSNACLREAREANSCAYSKK